MLVFLKKIGHKRPSRSPGDVRYLALGSGAVAGAVVANEFMDPIYNRSGQLGGTGRASANRSGGWIIADPWFVVPTPHGDSGLGVVTFSKWPNRTLWRKLNGGLDPNHLQVMG